MTPNCRNRRKIQLPDAFTLVELLLALAISVVVATTVVMMLAATARATRSKDDVRSALIRRQTATVRLGAAIRCAGMVLAAGPHHIVLWKNDVNGDRKPRLSELRRVEWDQASGEIRVCGAAANLNPADDAVFEMNSDFSAETAAISGSSIFPLRVMLRHAIDWNVALDNADIRAARTVVVRTTIETESGSDEVVVVGCLRSRLD